VLLARLLQIVGAMDTRTSQTADRAPFLRLVTPDDPARRRSAASSAHHVMPERNRRAAEAYRAAARRQTPRSGLGQSVPTDTDRIAGGRDLQRTVSEAARLDATDPRWAFAARVAVALDGPGAGTLPPEGRERLMRTARNLGIRPFQATLIIAAIQDRVRSGLTPLGPELGVALSIISPATPASIGRERTASIVQHGTTAPGPIGRFVTAFITATLAVAGAWMLAVWITGG
ncbi:MAG: hypothetical protein AAF235_11800, partial [Planctomycetota bacterium]